MARRTLPSNTLSAALRARLGLSQQELGDFLGVGVAQVGHVETGRRSYSASALARLYRLADLLPETSDPAPLLPPEIAATRPTVAEARALRARLRDCRNEVRRLGYKQDLWPEQDAALHRRQQTISRLEIALAAPATAGPDAAREQTWLELLRLATARTVQRRPSPTVRAWKDLRLSLLDTEIAGLEQLLTPGTSAGGPPAQPTE